MNTARTVLSREQLEQNPTLRAQLLTNGWRPVQSRTVASDGGVALEETFERQEYAENDLKYDIAKKDYRPALPATIGGLEDGDDAFLRKLIVECWSTDPTKRPSFDELVIKLQTELTRRGILTTNPNELTGKAKFMSVLKVRRTSYCVNVIELRLVFAVL